MSSVGKASAGFMKFSREFCTFLKTYSGIVDILVYQNVMEKGMGRLM
jgi:hypothetical protein